MTIVEQKNRFLPFFNLSLRYRTWPKVAALANSVSEWAGRDFQVGRPLVVVGVPASSVDQFGGEGRRRVIMVLAPQRHLQPPDVLLICSTINTIGR